MRCIELSMDSQLEQVALVDTCVHALCLLGQCGPEAARDIQLCVSEWLTNVIKHGYRNQPGQRVWLKVRLHPEYIGVDISDRGVALLQDTFDAVCKPVLTAAIDDLPEGGWGLYIIANTMDCIRYHSVDGLHTLSLSKSVEPPA